MGFTKSKGEMGEIYLEDWGPGWTSLTLTATFGIVLIWQARSLYKAQKALLTRILVTGSRGKSGTVRLLHVLFLANKIPTYSKITGTTAVELLPDGTEKPTVRRGAAGIPEMKSSLMRSRKLGAQVGVFESMAISPKLIDLVDRIIRPQIGIIPTIRLDHTEEEGADELEIAENILLAIARSKDIFTAVDQPEIIHRYRELANEHGFNVHFVTPSTDQPKIPGQHQTNIAIAIAIAKHLGLNWAGALDKSSLEPEANVFHRYSNNGQQVDLFDISSANDPESAGEAFQRLPVGEDRIVIPVVVNRWERPQRGVIFSSVFEDYEPFVLRVGTQKRGNRRFGIRTQNFTPLGLSHLTSMDSFLKFINSELALQTGANIALVLFANVHEPAADRIRHLFRTHGETLEQVKL
jgi:hypothetical protein